MGIDGLLKNLKQAMREKNLKDYKGQKAAVDTYAWLHKIIKGQCGREIITGKDQRKYVADCLKRVDKISKAGVDIILVFDGGALPRKRNEQQNRKKRRQENFQKGKQLLEKGNMDQGLKKMIDAIDVSPDIAYILIQQLKARGIKFIVAPYEADAQLAYLSRQNIVDFIITEDSDLLAFGAKKVLYKLDFQTMNGQQICLQEIKEDKAAGFNWFSHNQFLMTCIMAGCDYLDQIKGFGLKLAQKTISKNTTIKKALAQISLTKQIPPQYQENFMKALLTFRFQRVYCPRRKECVSVNQMRLKEIRQNIVFPQYQSWTEEVLDPAMIEFMLRMPINEDDPQWQFLGRKLSKQTSIKVAQGQINPIDFGQYDTDCLQKIKYKKQFNYQFPNSQYQKKKSPASTQSTNNILKYCRPIEKKNPLQYKSVKSRSINQEQYTVFNKQDSMSISFPVVPVAPFSGKKKKSLKFNDDSDEQDDEQHRDNDDSVSVVSFEGKSKSQNVSNSDILTREKSAKTSAGFKNNLQEISELYFNKLFSDQFLQSPFSSSI